MPSIEHSRLPRVAKQLGRWRDRFAARFDVVQHRLQRVLVRQSSRKFASSSHDERTSVTFGPSSRSFRNCGDRMFLPGIKGAAGLTICSGCTAQSSVFAMTCSFRAVVRLD